MDAGIVPACFEIHGNATVSAEFDEFSPFVRAVMQHLIYNIESCELHMPNQKSGIQINGDIYHHGKLVDHKRGSRSDVVTDSRAMVIEEDCLGKVKISAIEPTESGFRSESLRVSNAEASELYAKLGSFLSQSTKDAGYGPASDAKNQSDDS